MTSLTTDTAATRGQKRIALLFSILVLLALLIAPLLMKGFAVFQLTMIVIYAIAILSLNLLTGVSGQFSLGHSAFFAVGAYTVAILTEHLQLNYLLALPLAGLVSFGFGFLFGLPALRLSGIYLAVATFALAMAVPQILKLGLIEQWTGGAQGMVLTEMDPTLGFMVSRDHFVYYLTLAVALLVYWFALNLIGRRSGLALKAIRDNDIAASAMGVDTAHYKTLIFGVSSAIAGIAGGLGVIAVGFVSADAYTIQLAIILFLGIVISGVGWLPGSLAGAAFVVMTPHLAEEVSKGLSGAIFGFFIVFMIFVLPGGARQLAGYGSALLGRLLFGSRGA